MPPDRSAMVGESMTRSRGAQLLLATGLVLAIGAAAALVVTNDLRFLRLGILAALWAALVGAFIAARYRGRLADRDEHAADLQAIYELELEREIAARREHELRVESEIRTEVEEQSRQDLAALREEMQTLRQTLQSLIGGEVLVERYALHAQSTRMRALAEERRPPPMKRLTAGTSQPPPQPRPEPITERFDAVLETRPTPQPMPPQPQPRPQPPPQPRPEPRRDPPSEPRLAPPLPRRGDRAERPAWPPRDQAPAMVELTAVNPPPLPPPPPPPADPPTHLVERPRVVSPRVAETPRPTDPTKIVKQVRSSWEERLFAPPREPHPAEVSDRWFISDAFPQDGSGAQPPPGGRHARSEPETGGGRRRRAESSRTDLPAWQPEPRGGSHSQGNSVADLLAMHGDTGQRRRRRRED